MTVKELYRTFLGELSHIYDSREAAQITSIIFEHFAGIDRSAMVKEPEKELSVAIINEINNSLQLLKKNKPVQYITGEAWFYNMKLIVSPAVLIPRPETEELVERIIRSTDQKHHKKFIDIGTGSGCIAISIKRNIPLSHVTAIDISYEALEIAKENARTQEADIAFIQTDFLSQENWVQLASFDVIVSNPPYIPENEMKDMDKQVTEYEPKQALFVGTDRPLIFYEKILSFANDHLNKNGMIFLETHKDLANEVSDLFKNSNYSSEIRSDLSGNPRMVIITHYR